MRNVGRCSFATSTFSKDKIRNSLSTALGLVSERLPKYEFSLAACDCVVGQTQVQGASRVVCSAALHAGRDVVMKGHVRTLSANTEVFILSVCLSVCLPPSGSGSLYPPPGCLRLSNPSSSSPVRPRVVWSIGSDDDTAPPSTLSLFVSFSMFPPLSPPPSPHRRSHPPNSATPTKFFFLPLFVHTIYTNTGLS